MKLALVMLVLAVVAQFPSCGDMGFGNPNVTPQGDIVGFVDDKYISAQSGAPVPYIVIGATEYEVPIYFYREVHVNDLVKFSKGVWTIVKKAAR
ncbi:MAG TPA: hypothetical protein VGR24_12735 [bacterium]|nr:hypothetical protein [bacterium]